MNALIPVLTPVISKDIIYYCITSLTTSISSTQNLYNFIINFSNINNDYQIYQNKLINADLSNKLQVISLLITDIIKKYHFQDQNDEVNLSEWIEKCLHIKVNEDDGFHVVSNIKNNTLITDLPKPLKITLQSTLEIINNINCMLQQIQNKIHNYNCSYFSYFYKLNIHDDVNKLVTYCEIFDRRLTMLFDILKVYNNILL
jgi:iron-sulfur cluster repair protein YtfE (RIC family)